MPFPVNTCALISNGDARRAVVNFIVSAFAHEGKVVASSAVPITRDSNSTSYQDVVVGGFRMHQGIDVPIRAVSLRLGVPDESTTHVEPSSTPQSAPACAYSSRQCTTADRA